MRRLLQGDVGSGKTVVALYALLRAVEHGRQGALMAPTETLAAQHLVTVRELVGGLARCELLSAGLPAARRRQTLAGLADGTVQLAVGTHALLSEGATFQDLGRGGRRRAAPLRRRAARRAGPPSRSRAGSPRTCST